MLTILDSAQMKACDQNTINAHGIPSLCLMERAALAVFDEILSRFTTDSTVNVFCGSGNNGGDGVAIARLLYLEGFDVNVCIIGNPDKFSDQLKAEIKTAKSYGLPFTNSLDQLPECDIIIDALFGIGLSRDVEGIYKEAIEYINSSDTFVVACDIPSGFSADTGNCLGVGVMADLTVTFGYIKKGLLLSDCLLNRGELVLADVGIYLDEAPVGNKTFSLEESDLSLLPERPRNANKGSCGKLLVIAGSESIYGACHLSAKAAMTMGAGLVKIYTHANNIASIQQSLPEAMYASYTDYDEAQLADLLGWPDAILIGPGLGTNNISEQILTHALTSVSIPVIIDADAINLISKNLRLLNQCKGKIILTPHLKEMERLCSVPVSDINKKMEETALSFVKAYPSTLVLKNYVTLIATSPEEIYINTSGCEALATAGSGDVLAGIIAALIAGGMEPDTAAPLGVFIHGLAGEYAAVSKGISGVLASDIITSISEVLQ